MSLLKTSNNITYNSYVPISKSLLYKDEYKNLSSGAKILYEYIVDRWNLSKQNNYCNKKSEVYAFF
ncbi:MAG: replication initiator protein A [Clostridia bacterium]|nr:replication initiator protein A [Clostridia bacterium]